MEVMEQLIVASKINNASGVIIKIEDLRKFIDNIKYVEADHKADVRVEVNGEVKEFTLNEFLDKLGFAPLDF
jgi:hypothetical protein